MSHRLKFSKSRVKPNISGAVPFESLISKGIIMPSFPKKSITDVQIKKLCEDLDREVKPTENLQQFFSNKMVSIGPASFITQELDRILTINKTKQLKGFLLGFPFKCPVPIKTNYHMYPDLGELMFLYRLGQIAKTVSSSTEYKLKILILEETDSLSEVFDISAEDCQIVQQRLKTAVKLLGLKGYVQIKPLYKSLGFNLKEYQENFHKILKEIKSDPHQFQSLLDQVLPTIAMSVNKNQLSLEQSADFIKRSFQNKISERDHPELFECAYRYIAFSQIQKRSNFRQKYSNYLQMTLCPKPCRVAVRPTLSKVKILPHHGVPVVIEKSKSKQFQIMYFGDFMQKYQNSPIIEVTDKEDRFLFYQVVG